MSGTILGNDWHADSSSRPTQTIKPLGRVEILIEISLAPRAGSFRTLWHITNLARGSGGALSALPNRLLRQGA